MRNRIIIIFLLILWFSFSVPVHSAIPAEERTALIALYNSTNGSAWITREGWKGNHNESDGFSKIGSEGTWYGITVNNDHVTSIDLNNNNLVGTIPAELGNLTNLSQLCLYYNQLSGSMPAELGNLKNLKRLYLFNNRLTGSIPAELGNLSNLIGLSLVFNQLSGEIPRELGNLSNLKRLYLYFNQLTGDIPTELGQLKKLEELYLNENQLNGIIPLEIGNCSNLQILYLSSNQLMGNIPGELGKLKKLLFLILNNNMLTDNIPPELGNLTSLKKLYLNYNILEGEIPPDLGKLSKLEELYLNDNILDGKIPPDLGDLSSLKILYLSRNRLTNSIPWELSKLNNLLVLRLNSNRLQGKIPVEIKFLNKLIPDVSDFRWNALFTDQETVKNFLQSKQFGKEWENSQTVLPTNITASPLSANSIEVSWTPIAYANDLGGYDVYYSENPEDLEAPYSSTTSKRESSLEVTGLNPLTTYYFKVQTRTDSHSNNYNIVLSEKSVEVSAVTMEAKKTISGKVTDATGIGIEDVTLTFSSPKSMEETEKTKADGTYEHQVNPGWSGTVTPSKGTLFFSPPRLDFPNVSSDQPGQDFQLSLTLTLSATWEEDKAALIKIYYGKIKINYIRIDTEGLASIQLTIYRKTSGDDNYQAIKSFPIPMANICELTYDDKNLDKNKSYTYIARAIDNNGNTLGESNEISISANK